MFFCVRIVLLFVIIASTYISAQHLFLIDKIDLIKYIYQGSNSNLKFNYIILNYGIKMSYDQSEYLYLGQFDQDSFNLSQKQSNVANRASLNIQMQSNNNPQNVQEQKNSQNTPKRSLSPPEIGLLNQIELLNSINEVSTKIKKNNLPKFIIRIFEKYIKHRFCQEESLLQNQPALRDNLIQKLQRNVKKQVSPKKHSNLSDLIYFFGQCSSKNSEIQRNQNQKQKRKKIQQRQIRRGQTQLNRIAIRKIIRKTLKEQVINNKKLKWKKNYLIGLKIYALRCLSISLTGRTQSD